MPFAIEMTFDAAAEERVRRIFRRIAGAGLPSRLLERGLAPHVSLAVCDELSPAEFAPRLAEFAAGERAQRIALATPSTFATAEGVLFLGPVVTRALLDLHARFHPLFERAAISPWSHYLPGAWVPHCTLTFGLDPKQLGEAMQVCAGAGLPIEATLESVAIVEPRRAEIHASFPFGRAAE
jgi:2'-5' RNA ligase superfamily